MGQGIFIANIIGTLPELGDDFASKNWGDMAATLVDDIAQGALLYIQKNGSERLKELVETTHILEVALLAIEGMSVLNGFGQVEEGARFEAARAYFGTADTALKFATPDDHWQGSGSEAYAAANDKQRAHVQALLELDKQLQDILENEAGLVEGMRNFLGIWKGVITAAVFIAIALAAVAVAGPDASFAFQVVVAFAAIGACVIKEIMTVMESAKYARNVNELTAKYSGLAKAAKLPPDWSIQVAVPAAAQTTVSDFEAISSSMSDSLAMPDTAGLAGATSGSRDQRAALGARTGEGETPAGGTPGETPDATTPATPPFTMPAVAQPTALSGQAAKLSEVWQVASKRRQDQGSAARADKAAAEAAPAGGVEGAASGTEAAERAPLEVTVGAPAQEPSPLQRSA
jgi:hypothetical protein